MKSDAEKEHAYERAAVLTHTHHRAWSTHPCLNAFASKTPLCCFWATNDCAAAGAGRLLPAPGLVSASCKAILWCNSLAFTFSDTTLRSFVNRPSSLPAVFRRNSGGAGPAGLGPVNSQPAVFRRQRGAGSSPLLTPGVCHQPL